MTNRYARGKIYKIVSENTDKVYVGSTTEKTLARRLAKHVELHREYLKGNQRRYTSSFDIIEKGDYSIVLLENFPCESKDELFARERYYYEQQKQSIVNIKPPILTQQERKDYRNKKKQSYINRHREEVQAKRQQKFDCECGGHYSRSAKSRHFNSILHKTYILQRN